jgi:uncharacterized phage protein (predicted DNA packaging)
MEYLSIEYIKKHSRIDYDCEDDLIDVYGSAAERAILNLLGRSLDDLKEANDGLVPQDVIVATFQLADNLIRHRSPVEQVNLSAVPYGYDLMLKPYIVL